MLFYHAGIGIRSITARGFLAIARGHLAERDAYNSYALFRRIPSTLMKKLPKSVWNPSMHSVAPGITQRIVTE